MLQFITVFTTILISRLLLPRCFSEMFLLEEYQIFIITFKKQKTKKTKKQKQAKNKTKQNKKPQKIKQTEKKQTTTTTTTKQRQLGTFVQLCRLAFEKGNKFTNCFWSAISLETEKFGKFTENISRSFRSCL